jgi:hypothetical protein
MIANSLIRWSAVLILVAGSALALSDRGCAQTRTGLPAVSTNVEGWQKTDLSIVDFAESEYDLVAVISASPHTRIYFLTKPGKIVKCREEVTPNGVPQLSSGQLGTSLPEPPPTSGEIGMAGTMPPGKIGPVVAAPPPLIPPPDVSGFRTEFECAELLRGGSRQ